MRFFPHDPADLRRRGRRLAAGGGLFSAALAVGVLLDGSWVNVIWIVMGGFVGLGVTLVGATMLRDARSLERERRLRAEARPESFTPAVEIRPRAPAVEPRPDVRPPRPVRRLICVSVMFAGLIGPLLLGIFSAAPRGLEQAVMALFFLGLCSFLGWAGVALWDAKRWAYVVGVAVFAFGSLIGLMALGGCLMDGDGKGLLIAAAVLAYFGCGLGAVVSLNGPWLRHGEWTPARDLLATSDKATVLKALRERGVRPRRAQDD